jgi:hypothetical protein
MTETRQKAKTGEMTGFQAVLIQAKIITLGMAAL